MSMLTAREIARNSLRRAGYKTSPATLQLPEPNSLQREIIDHTSRFKILACGRRWGKTTVNIRILAERAIAGQTLGYFSFTYKNLAETFRELKRVLAPITLRSSQTEGRIELKNGGLVEFWSLQSLTADTARGRKYDFLVLDEAAYIPNGDYVWDAVIRPTLADKQGGALLTSTPAGANHFQTWYLRGTKENKDEFPNWNSWHYPTSTNPAIKADELAQIEKETPYYYFRQEYLAEFVETVGAVFGDFAHALYTPPEGDAWQDGHVYVAAADWGQENDYSVVSIKDVTDNREVFLCRWRQIPWADIRRNMLDACELWHVDELYPERNAMGTTNIEALENEAQARGMKIDFVSFSMSNDRKSSMVSQLYSSIHDGDYKILDIPWANAELKSFVSKQNHNGQWTYGGENNSHDDSVIARMAANWGAARRI